ncbi:MAG: hypothetical protein JSU99_10530, partial [Nitrospiraceae bacterium]
MKTVIHSILIFLSITTVLVLTEVRAYTADYFHMDRPKLGIELDFEYEEETREGPYVSRKDQTTDLTERLDIATGGWIYHPALATYSLVISPEWQQSRETNSSGPSSTVTTSDSFLQGYDAELVLLPRKPYTLTLFARRQTDSFNNNFSGRTKTEETSYGSHFVLKSGLFPTSISYMHLDSQTSGYFTGDKDRDDLKFTSSNTSKFGSFQLSGSYSTSDETLNENVLDSEQQLFSLLHSRSFLENNKAILRSSLIYTDTKNTNNTNRGVSASQNLSFRHRKNLRTQYTLRYDKRTLFNELNPTKTVDRTASGQFNLTHLLYENLTTSVNASAIRFRTTGSEEVRYDSGAAFLYYRSLPVGSIRAEMGQQFNVTKVDSSSDFSRVNDEPVSLTSAFTDLKQEDIDINSIIVKDSSGFVYPEPGNYIISRTGSLTRIRCIIGGLLDAVLDCSAGAPVLIDYEYRILYPFDYWTHDQSYGVSLNLVKTMDIYYRFSKS